MFSGQPVKRPTASILSTFPIGIIAITNPSSWSAQRNLFANRRQNCASRLAIAQPPTHRVEVLVGDGLVNSKPELVQSPSTGENSVTDNGLGALSVGHRHLR